MKYNVEYTKNALKQLKKLDRQTTSFILSFIEKRLIGCDNPRQFGKALQGNMNDKWRYRVGDYRILAKIEDERVIITVIEIGHRRDIYK
ncbi:mRNA interferase RelE/StbE [Dethiosulfatibacter aminovorans DSM 17477]|uniref:mRNA interferase RelE/StbE n=1 Tax=Dethiosulfatibacter aminovorans DSM 17477 TaxID=1121476 RepID=A0A1M6N3J3_9FIRM|nr:type II toxin-antitoxin system RelE/ParE family toxin [Dethiosulfatibacter aminovorans]SHJ90290.1 mRNA interferase RelE/StbE [Dethiosulfatibacter aminovorans DSM 17477]